MPALSYTLLSFGIILLLSRLKAPLAVAICAGAAAAGLFFGCGPGELVRLALAGVTQGTSVGLLLTIALLLILSEAMRQTGRLERIVSLVQAVVRRPAVTLAALPAMIGLLPMPGGALFSAPMVRQAAQETPLENDLLSALNYWWRHIWEHWWPLYPGVILAMGLTGSGLLEFALFQIPLGGFMVLAGMLMYRRMPSDVHRKGAPPPPGTKRQLAKEAAPIGLILAVWFAGDLTLKAVAAAAGFGMGGEVARWWPIVQKFAPLLAGLIVSLGFVLWTRPLPAGQAVRLMTGKDMAPLLGLVASVMIYQHVLEQVHAAGRIGAEMMAFHVPAITAVILLPFIAGVLTGVAFGFVGVSFPIVLSLVASLPDHPAMRPYAVLAYACGHLGMMISPIHLCYVVSNRYFATTFRATFRHILGPCWVTGALVTVYFLVLKWAM
jgi:hypothetical protein